MSKAMASGSKLLRTSSRVDSSANELDHAGVDAGEFEQGGHQVLNAGLQRLDEAQALDQIFGIAPCGKTVADEPVSYTHLNLPGRQNR